MKLSRLNLFLSIMLVLVIVAITMIRVDHSQPNYEFLPDMKHSPAWDAYSKNPNFTNGQTLQAPVPGTIARGELPLHFTNSKEDALRAGIEFKNPYDLTELKAKVAASKSEEKKVKQDPPKNEKVNPLVEEFKIAQTALRDSTLRGAEKYNTFCIACHGASGKGDGPVAKRGFPPPPSLLTGKSRTEMKDGQLFHIIGYGQGSMPNFAAQLSQKQRWDVVNYIRSMQSKAPPIQPAPKKAEPKEEGLKEETPKKGGPKEETPEKELPKKEIPKKETPEKEVPKKEVPKKETPEKDKTTKDIKPTSDTDKKDKK